MLGLTFLLDFIDFCPEKFSLYFSLDRYKINVPSESQYQEPNRTSQRKVTHKKSSILMILVLLEILRCF